MSHDMNTAPGIFSCVANDLAENYEDLQSLVNKSIALWDFKCTDKLYADSTSVCVLTT